MGAIKIAIEKIRSATTGEDVKKGLLDGLKATDESIKKLELCICLQGIALIILAFIELKR